ncbi:MAG TPA: ABC transporter ATP-binding protein [Herpetosiphonaceae bacterium]|nr:ABC transporter ATP-binding protein [Herpetosiphonaceae bacterium]
MNNLRWLRPYLRRHRGTLILGFLIAALSSGASTISPYLLRRAVDDLNSRGVDLGRLGLLGLLILGAAAINGILNFGQRNIIGSVSYRIEYALRGDLFRKLLDLDQDFYGSSHTGDLMARATNDLSAVRQFLGPGLTSVASSGLTLIVCAAWMLIIDVPLALVTLILLPLITITFVAIRQPMRTRFTKVQEQFGELSTHAQENFSGIRTIKAYAQEEAEIADFLQANRDYQRLNLRFVLLSGVLWPLMALLMGLTTGLILLLGGQAVASGRLTLGEFVQFNAYLGVLSWPMISLGWTVTLYQQGSASMGRIAEVLNRQPLIKSPTAPAPLTRIRGDIRFEDVGVRYGNTWIVRHISFEVPVGGSLAIVGATGAGKTTLVNLIGRVRDPAEGRVLIDGYDVRDLPLDLLRRSVGYVPQDTFLFSLPLRENVEFGRADRPSQTEFEDALLVSQLVNDLPQFPEGMETMLGERGVTLSGGQKQRTAIARAILRDPAVLILDDALSSVDTHTAAEILRHLRRVMVGRTTIIIAQRIATVKDADEIIVIDDGEIVERGVHSELVRTDGHYAAMYRRELLREEMSDNGRDELQTSVRNDGHGTRV